MARPGARAWNPAAQTMTTFLTTAQAGGGLRLAVEFAVAPGEALPATAHIHDGPAGWIGERFRVLAGACTLRVGDAEIAARAGDTVAVPCLVPHVHPRNTGGTVLVVRQIITPHIAMPALTLGVERFFETAAALSQQGRMGRDGSFADSLQGALSTHDLLMPYTYAAGLPFFAQDAGLNALAMLARSRGLVPWHEPAWEPA